MYSQRRHNEQPEGASAARPSASGKTEASTAAAAHSISHTFAQSSSIIEGEFTYDALADLFLYLCHRQENLLWQLVTLAGTFTVLFEKGQPVDIMFRPVRPIGAYVGVKALRTLFQQEGGQFSVRRSKTPPSRRSLQGSGENLLIALATSDDEHNAPAVLSGTTFDDSAELSAVADVAPEAYQTAFLTSSDDTPLPEVLQLFSVSRRAYRVSLFVRQGTNHQFVGSIDLSASDVSNAATPSLEGKDAFNALMSMTGSFEIEVNPVILDWETPLGKLDGLLLKAVLSSLVSQEPVEGSGTEVPTAQHPTLQPPEADKPSAESTLQRFGKLMRRKL